MIRSRNPEINNNNYCDRMIGAVKAKDLNDMNFLLAMNSNLAKLGENDSYYRFSAIEIALNNGDTEAVALLLKNDADIDIYVLDGTKQDLIVKGLLFKNENNIDKVFTCQIGEITALGLAVYMKDVIRAQLLLEGGADVNQSFQDFQGSLLHLAVEIFHEPMVRCLLGDCWESASFLSKLVA